MNKNSFQTLIISTTITPKKSDYRIIKLKIYRPHSREALKRNGIELKDLLHVPFKDYVKNNTEIKNIDIDLQKARYNHFFNKQSEKIKMVKEERINLISNPMVSSNKGLLLSKIYSSSAILPESPHNYSHVSHGESGLKMVQNENSTVIKNEQLKLERMKQKQVLRVF